VPQRRDERVLQEALAQARAVLASTLDPVLTIDAAGIIQSASASVERVFGWSPEELVGRNVRVLMPKPHSERHDGYLERYRRTGVTTILGRPREFEGLRRDGTTFPIEISVSRVDLPRPLFTGIVRDLTQRRREEEELRRYRDRLEDLVKERTRELEASHEQLRTADRLASIGTLAAGLGHDMNNVLLPVRCRLDALAAQDLPPAAREHFDAVRKSVQYLQQLADGLHLLALDPQADLPAESTDLAEWWEQVGPLLARGLPRHVRLATSWPRQLPRVAVPAHRLTQAALNLVVNAGEAVGPEGAVRVWAEAFDHGAGVRLGVTDNGHGMRPEVKRRALDPFFTTKKRGLGTGLGLSLVQAVARSAGGSIDIESEPGRGTTVVLTLPAESRAGRAAGPAELRASVAVADRRLASLAEAIVAGAGIDVRHNGAPDPAADLWITDGTGEAARLAAQSPRRRQVVVLGAGGEAWTAVPAVFVTDPEDFEALRDAIGRAVTLLTGEQA
jgi:PAS domain S-box-containing protein